ncbi:TetR/AcrR family transcriptional regulator [Actinoplanes sp. ATCC 53533]|uniref:TetR/AcrR family transcriptional regulator n=1 Tax=Actinoplanes sp. ATCC 53533 TaxID=1288362 RepID=UPI0018F68BA2|nr:TetR/AcrR family transcriptional regulator [Actinoplanes sp. ATCC 53533]
MTTSTPNPVIGGPAGPPGPRRRDAAGTQQSLLDAARRRFAADGYAATTVRDIADEAGVNVALINRYFTSKEGLFKACLTGAADELGRTVAANVTLDQVPDAIARQLAGPHTGKHPSLLVLLLRSSGDARADQIRLGVLRSFAERLAATAGRLPGDPDDERLLLRAQIALAAALGIALLRSTAAMEPLDSAGEQELVDPLRDMINALLG